MEPRRGIDALVAEALKRDGVFTSQEAAEQGVSSPALTRALKSGRIQRVLPRVYLVTGARVTWWARARAGVAWSGGALSHKAAAFALGLVDTAPDRIDLATTAGRTPPPGARLRCHRSSRLSPPHVSSVRGIRVTAPARTLLDIASEVSEQELEAAMEEGLRRGLLSIARIGWQLNIEGQRGRSGTAALRKLLHERDPRSAPTESPLETKVARWFRSTRLPPPVRQHRVIADEKFVGRIDFAYPEAKLAIEAQSYRWHSGRREWLRDQTKERRLRELGWDVMYLIEEDIGERSAALEAEIARRLGVTLF